MTKRKFAPKNVSNVIYVFTDHPEGKVMKYLMVMAEDDIVYMNLKGGMRGRGLVGEVLATQTLEGPSSAVAKVILASELYRA